MKRLFFLLLLLYAIEAFSQKKALIPVDSTRLKADVSFLTGLPGGRNYRNLKALNEAADYILDVFKNSGAEDFYEQEYFIEGVRYRNIIARFGPLSGPVIVVGAHYDVYGPFPGADDNASGTAGLLELARLLGQLKPQLKYPVELVAYTLEEPPFFSTQYMGSFIHAKSLQDERAKVKMMISLEMIGYFSDKKGSQDFPMGFLKLFYPSRGNIIVVVGDFKNFRPVRKVRRKMRAGSDIKVRTINAPRWIEGIDFSDHRNYWHFGYDAVMVTNTAFYRNKNYHQPTDTKETLNYSKMAEVLRGVYNVIVKMR
jgi:hypothetical protein